MKAGQDQRDCHCYHWECGYYFCLCPSLWAAPASRWTSCLLGLWGKRNACYALNHQNRTVLFRTDPLHFTETGACLSDHVHRHVVKEIIWIILYLYFHVIKVLWSCFKQNNATWGEFWGSESCSGKQWECGGEQVPLLEPRHLPGGQPGQRQPHLWDGGRLVCLCLLHLDNWKGYILPCWSQNESQWIKQVGSSSSNLWWTLHLRENRQWRLQPNRIKQFLPQERMRRYI